MQSEQRHTDMLAGMFAAIEESLQMAVHQASVSEEIGSETGGSETGGSETGAMRGSRTAELERMLAYHMGWEEVPDSHTAPRGKRIRPLLVLLTTASAGADWRKALPGAAAVELLHNFSLIHDDIEDNSPLRRGRETVWTIWGVPQAINAGDTLFSLAQATLLDLENTASPASALKAARVFQETCLRLTQGQFLDISYEGRSDLGVDDYWPMVSGKTAALISACTQIGALVAECSQPARAAYTNFGRYLGLAYQVQDDLLGIWGEAALTGKSTASDLVSGKKSLPVLYGLSRQGPFAERWSRGSIQPEETATLAEQLKQEGGYAYTQEAADDLTRQALEALEKSQPQGEAGQALIALTHRLLRRDS